MITDTPAPTETPSPTLTPTPSVTPTPTPDFYLEVTTPGGEAARIERVIGVGDYVIILLLFALLISIWGMWIVQRLERKRGK